MDRLTIQTQTNSGTNFRLSLMMFLQFFIWGSFFVTLGGYLAKTFPNQNIIGEIYSTNNWAALIAPLFVGLVADRFFNAERVNGVLHLVGAAVLWKCSQVTHSADALFWWLLVYFACYMPTLALVNTITFHNVRSADDEFPKIRLWGTIGWIVAGIVVAQSVFGLVNIPILGDMKDAGSTAFPMQLGAVVSVIYGLYSFTLPATPPSGRGSSISIAKMLGFDALSLFKDRSFAIFGVCSFLICIPLAFYYAAAYSYVSTVAFGAKTAGVMALGQVSEIVFMALVPFFFRKLGVKWMLLVGMLAWTARYVVFGLSPEAPAMLVLGIALHGICYDFFFVTGQLYTDRKAPLAIRSSAQGLISLITYGGGMLVGNKVHDWWVEKIALKTAVEGAWAAGAKEFWLLPAGVALAVAVIFALTFNDRSSKPKLSAAPAELP
jgi:nucleoside transporter